MRAGQIDALSNLDPVISLLARSGDLKVLSDTRIVAEAAVLPLGDPDGLQVALARTAG